jgi:hypothetical protein
VDNTAKKLRDLIAIYRGLLAKGPELSLTRHYLNEIVLAELRLRSLTDHPSERFPIGDGVTPARPTPDARHRRAPS